MGEHSYMKAPRTNRIAEIRKAKGLSQQQLAERVGSHWITISKLERGQMSLTQSWMERLSQSLHVEPEDLLPGERSLGSVAVVGAVLENGVVNIPVTIEGDGDAASVTHNRFEVTYVSSSFINDPDSQWLRIASYALAPLFNPGDFIRITWLDLSQAEDMVGRVCLVHIDGEQDVFGTLAFGSKHGTWTLQGISAPSYFDVKISAIARISAAIFEEPPYR